MNSVQKEDEARFLREVLVYRDDYRRRQAEALAEERARRHSNGEVYVAGCWVPSAYVAQVVRELQRRDRIMFVEIVVGLVLITVAAYVFWRLFAFLLLPNLG
jgi:hypothetical protein